MYIQSQISRDLDPSKLALHHHLCIWSFVQPVCGIAGAGKPIASGAKTPGYSEVLWAHRTGWSQSAKPAIEVITLFDRPALLSQDSRTIEAAVVVPLWNMHVCLTQEALGPSVKRTVVSATNARKALRTCSLLNWCSTVACKVK